MERDATGRPKRIGIYTQAPRLNYGGILQAWALQTVLLRKGFDAVTLCPDPICRLSPLQKPYRYGRRLVRKLLGLGGYIFWEDAWNRAYAEATQFIRPFVEKRIRRRVYRDVREIEHGEFDILVAGSDQVWRPRYHAVAPDAIEHSFFDFAREWNVKRVAYAASFGTDEWEFTPEQTGKCAALAQKFAAVSVREKSGVSLCREHLGIDAVQMPDPTLLLTRSDYEALIEDAGNTQSPNGNMLCYILDESPEVSGFVRAAEARGFQPFRVPMWSGIPPKGEPNVVQPSVEQWLRNILDADFVATDSFHACVFSILFGKPFVVFGNAVRGMSRYESLLGELGLADRLVTTSREGLERLEQWTDTGVDAVRAGLAAMRKRAGDFLQVLA